jgi:hypothetical protein
MLVLLCITLLSSALLSTCDLSGNSNRSIFGIVSDGEGPVEGATVRVQATDRFTVTARGGHFSLDTERMGDGPFNLTAWAPGYFCAGPVSASPGSGNVVIELHSHDSGDNQEYEWIPSYAHPETGESEGCSECHSSEGTGLPYTLPVDEWLADAHSGSAENKRFLTMYLGTDVFSNQSPVTRHVMHPDYGRIPIPPDPTKPYFGPGFKLDFPDTSGNCASCHTPAAAINVPYGTDPTNLSGVLSEGVPCDFCHKIWDVTLDPVTGIPFENMPGVISFEFRRPPDGSQFFAGPFDDVAPGEDTYLPLMNESRFCAPCHFGVFWGTVVYNSFGEWLESPYSDPSTGRTCQDCHMPRLGATSFVRPDKGGLTRDSARIFSHLMPGAADRKLLRNAVTLAASARREGSTLMVEVAVINDGTGHHVPTDSPLRQVILLVRATDSGGCTLIQSGGPTVPEWGGIGDPENGNYGGLPGKGFAKILEELWTEVSPTGAYWNQTRLMSDTRIPALATDGSVYTFDASHGEITVEIKLIFRRAFIELMDQKGWDVPDVVMAELTLTVP